MENTESCLSSEETGSTSSTSDEEKSPCGDEITLFEILEIRADSDEDSTAKNEKLCDGGFYDVKVFMTILFLLGVAQGFAVNGINSINIPMYERRFHLTSTQTGLIVSTLDIVSVFTLLVLGYFMSRLSQPKLLAFSSACLGLGSLIMALPHLLTEEYRVADAKPAVCNERGNDTNVVCTYTTADIEDSLSNYLSMFLVGQGLHGVSGTLLHVVGPAFIDGSVSDKQSPVYLGIFFSAPIIGPASGYMLGGWLLDQYVDFPKSPPPYLTSTSPAWVGAWWIGFLISSALGFVTAIPLLMFPRVLPGTEARRINNVNQAHSVKKFKEESEEQACYGSGKEAVLRNFWSILNFMRNPALLFQCISMAAEGAQAAATTTFLTKFVANQFNMRAGQASIITGLIALPSMLLGQMTGAAVVKRFDLKVRGILKFNMCMTVVSLALSAIFLTNCDLPDIAGVNYPYNPISDGNTSNIIDLTAECNADCSCDTTIYEPICINGVEYFTPCHAGCSSKLDPDTKTYQDCTCSGLTSHSNGSFYQPPAVYGKCKSDCKNVYIFLPVMGLFMLVTFAVLVPATTVILRSVVDSQRTFAVTIKQIIVRLLGTIPGPLLLGAVLDKTCLLWQEKCDDSGSCWLYDNDLMGRNVFILVTTCKLISLVALGLGCKLYVPPSTAS